MFQRSSVDALTTAYAHLIGLIFAGHRQLEDSRALLDYNIQKVCLASVPYFQHWCFLVFRLRGGGCRNYILTKAAELDDDDETIETKFYPLDNRILNYRFPADKGFDVSPQW